MKTAFHKIMERKDRKLDPPPINDPLLPRTIRQQALFHYSESKTKTKDITKNSDLPTSQVWFSDLWLQMQQIKTRQTGELEGERYLTHDQLKEEAKKHTLENLDLIWNLFLRKYFTRDPKFTSICPNLKDLERESMEKIAASVIGHNKNFSLADVPNLVGSFYEKWKGNTTLGKRKDKKDETAATPGLVWDDKEVAKVMEDISFFVKKMGWIYKNRICYCDTYENLNDTLYFGEGNPKEADVLYANHEIFLVVRFPPSEDFPMGFKMQYFVPFDYLYTQPIQREFSSPQIVVVRRQLGQNKEPSHVDKIQRLLQACAANRFFTNGKFAAQPEMDFDSLNPYQTLILNKIYNTRGIDDFWYDPASLDTTEISQALDMLYFLAQDWKEHEDEYKAARKNKSSNDFVLPYLPKTERDTRFQHPIPK